MDRELNEDERRAIERLAMADPQVRAVTELRTRAAGPHLHLQMRLDLDETLIHSSNVPISRPDIQFKMEKDG